ncbi:very large A-kinase anchor protein [Dendropsophus ebraccatus]|uniref:very large A-kinase anchor protein n=1 Tax=Dendropsophus ebraccatus TaxID=150705 RepID=UPI0038320495
MESVSLGTEGSMEDIIYNNTCEESSNSSEFLDLLHFSVYSSRYVEINESDDESTDEEKDNSSEQASGNDSFLSVQSRRVRIYPFSLSPIYEDDSACEDTLSNCGSPRYNNEGASASNSGHDHTSILSLLQSVSDRLKEADLEETSPEERFLSLDSEVFVGNDKVNKEGSGELKEITFPSKPSIDVPSILEDDKSPLGKRSGLFITKSLADKPNPGTGRQSFLLNLKSHSNIYGTKPSTEIGPVPSVTNELSVATSNPDQSPNPPPSTAAVNSLSIEPVLPIQRSALDDKSHMSSNSVLYQYLHSARKNVSNAEAKGSPQEEPKKTAELDMDPADSDSLKFNPRPGKVILSDVIDQANEIELKTDILDATSWVFPNGVNIRVIRGCWILYEKAHFEGQAHVLEEGEAVLRHLWDLPGAEAKLDKITIGSVKRVVKDYLPQVVISSLQDASDSPIYIRTEVLSLENLVGKHPRSIVVNSGVWLAYTEPQYNGTVTVLEEGSELPQIQDSGLKSMRPLKMGGLKVQLPSDPRIIIYEKPHFLGWSRELTEHVSSIGTLTCDGEDGRSRDIGSIQVISGIWVGYENERYKGQQYLLEEGDYEDWHAWGGYNNTLQSIRYLQADFIEPSVTLYEMEEEDEKQINLFNQAIPDLELAGYSTRTQCIHVKKGMWVAYRQKHYCGEQYILEKGRYKTYVDWGGNNNTIMSIRPVLLEPLGQNDAKHLVKAYTRTEFQGESMDFTQVVSDFTSFSPMSFKVIRGCWLLCYKEGTCDNLCVLEEGHFPDLASCGCPTAEIKYIKPIDYVFSEPSISLFALDSCEGRELHFEEAVTSILSKDLHFYAQSVWVRRGLWIAFEGANFLGRQMLLDPQQILNWSQFSGWKAIGSLRPLKQPSVYFMVKNRDKDKYLTVTGTVADSRATFVTVSPRNGQNTQIWYFCRGFLKSKANDLCLDVIGGKNIPGSKVSLWAEHGKTRQKWTVNKDGTISSHISDDLVLDLRGGNYYDQNYTVVNRFQENVLTQKWDMEIL